MTTLKSNIKSYTGNKQVNDKKIQKVLFNILFHHIEELVFVMENVKKHRVFIFQDQFRLYIWHKTRQLGWDISISVNNSSSFQDPL